MIPTPKISAKESLLKNARELFWKHGIKRISVEEICQSSSVSKMTFYRYFENKIAIAENILNTELPEKIAEYRRLMDQEIPFEKKVQQMISQKQKNAAGVSQEFLHDIYSNDILILKHIVDKFSKKMQGMVEHDFLEAQKNGEIRNDMNVHAILYLMQDMRLKIEDPVLQGMYDKPEDLILDMTRFFFYGICNNPTNLS